MNEGFGLMTEKFVGVGLRVSSEIASLQELPVDFEQLIRVGEIPYLSGSNCLAGVEEYGVGLDEAVDGGNENKEVLFRNRGDAYTSLGIGKHDRLWSEVEGGIVLESAVWWNRNAPFSAFCDDFLTADGYEVRIAYLARITVQAIRNNPGKIAFVGDVKNVSVFWF